MSAEQALAGCPFCGGPLRIGRSVRAVGFGPYRLLCMSDDNCFFMDFDSEAEAIEMGNRRPTPSPSMEGAETEQAARKMVNALDLVQAISTDIVLRRVALEALAEAKECGLEPSQ